MITYHLWQDLTKFSCDQNMNLKIFRHPSIILVIRISYRIWQFFGKAYKILLSMDSFILGVLLFVHVTQTPYLIHRRAHPFVFHLQHQFSIHYIFLILVPPMCQTQWYSLLDHLYDPLLLRPHIMKQFGLQFSHSYQYQFQNLHKNPHTALLPYTNL